jgi:hypothetical protein
LGRGGGDVEACPGVLPDAASERQQATSRPGVLPIAHGCSGGRRFRSGNDRGRLELFRNAGPQARPATLRRAEALGWAAFVIPRYRGARTATPFATRLAREASSGPAARSRCRLPGPPEGCFEPARPRPTFALRAHFHGIARVRRPRHWFIGRELHGGAWIMPRRPVPGPRSAANGPRSRGLVNRQQEPKRASTAVRLADLAADSPLWLRRAQPV